MWLLTVPYTGNITRSESIFGRIEKGSDIEHKVNK